METKEKLKLNLGCRNRSIPGFKGMDIDQHESVDIVGDISDLSQFGGGSVSEIYASHVLEHFPHPLTVSVLVEWNRVLENGGILYVAVPDFKRAVEIYNKMGLQDWIVNQLYGDQGYETAFHYTGFDFNRMSHILKLAGFKELSQVGTFPIGNERDCSRNVSSIDGKSVSLNIIAVK